MPIDESRAFVPVTVAVLTVSDTRTLADDRSGDTLVARIEAAGHRVGARAIERDDADPIERHLRGWIADPAIDCVITTGGTGITGRDVTPEAFDRVLEKRIEGFGELFRMLSFQKIGTSTMQSRALGGVAGGTLLFALPGSTGAVKDAWDDILLWQLDCAAPALQLGRADAAASGAPGTHALVLIPFLTGSAELCIVRLEQEGNISMPDGSLHSVQPDRDALASCSWDDVADPGPATVLPGLAQKGRGAVTNPASRFDAQHGAPVDDGWSFLTGEELTVPPTRTELIRDTSRSAIAWNDSPDVGFDRAVNPYRGCEHGCIYCYARPSHAYLGYSPGLDFETKIVFKPDVARLLERELSRPGYEPRTMGLGSNTDPYQPVERTLRLTRAVLEVLERFNHPVSIVTKSAGVMARPRHPGAHGGQGPGAGLAVDHHAGPGTGARHGAAGQHAGAPAGRRSRRCRRPAFPRACWPPR